MKPPRQFAAIVLAAGQGTRMKSALPKVLHPVAGAPMVRHVLDAVAALKPARTVVVVAPGMEAVAKAVAPAETAVQDPPKGTGHAVMSARAALGDFDGDVLIVCGDTPLIRAASLAALLQARCSRQAPAVALLAFSSADPGAYGRVIATKAGAVTRIVEFRDASAVERKVDLCNAGIWAVDGKWLFRLLDEVKPNNAQGEYYLTDIVGLARRHKLKCAMVIGDAEDAQGVNSRAELAAAEAAMQRRLRARAMADGVTMIDPDTVWLRADTRLARDVVIEPQVVFGAGVTVGEGAHIRAFSHLDGAEVGQRAIVGPYARLRPGAKIAADAHIGNFVEIKNADIEAGAKVNHLSYIGDARVGAKANIGAGTITCNYDGFAKHRTDIGKGAFIGSNTALVAPVKVGDGAIVGAGSVITEDVPAGALAVERAPQKTVPAGAARLKARRLAATSGKTG
jgi:bifunctional UDP-N-acetylglucosamine pyrophosphorylase/glucosamine-1-phosphate N-acetyltransferase